MRVVLLANTHSGSGRAEHVTATLERAIQNAGHQATVVNPRTSDLAAKLAGADAAVVLGGDGTVHYALGAIADAQIPMYHCPLGTENLFARHFSMRTDAARVVRALAGGATQVDLGDCDGRAFAIMLSVGPDAGVMRRMTLQRKGPITHLSYTIPVLAEAMRPSLRAFSATVDGAAFVSDESGLLVIANSPQYALRLNPAPLARVDDRLLHATFIPARTTLGLSAAMALSRLRLHIRLGLARSKTGTRVHITAPGLPVQIDGEACDFDAGNLDISIRPNALRVLAS